MCNFTMADKSLINEKQYSDLHVAVAGFFITTKKMKMIRSAVTYGTRTLNKQQVTGTFD